MNANEFPDLTGGIGEQYRTLAEGVLGQMMLLQHRNTLLREAVRRLNEDLNKRPVLQVNSHSIDTNDEGIIIHTIELPGAKVIAAEGRPGIDVVGDTALAFVGRLQRVDHASRQ